MQEYEIYIYFYFIVFTFHNVHITLFELMTILVIIEYFNFIKIRWTCLYPQGKGSTNICPYSVPADPSSFPVHTNAKNVHIRIIFM